MSRVNTIFVFRDIKPSRRGMRLCDQAWGVKAGSNTRG